MLFFFRRLEAMAALYLSAVAMTVPDKKGGEENNGDHLHHHILIFFFSSKNQQGQESTTKVEIISITSVIKLVDVLLLAKSHQQHLALPLPCVCVDTSRVCCWFQSISCSRPVHKSLLLLLCVRVPSHLIRLTTVITSHSKALE